MDIWREPRRSRSLPRTQPSLYSSYARVIAGVAHFHRFMQVPIQQNNHSFSRHCSSCCCCSSSMTCCCSGRCCVASTVKSIMVGAHSIATGARCPGWSPRCHSASGPTSFAITCSRQRPRCSRPQRTCPYVTTSPHGPFVQQSRRSTSTERCDAPRPATTSRLPGQRATPWVVQRGEGCPISARPGV